MWIHWVKVQNYSKKQIIVISVTILFCYSYMYTVYFDYMHPLLFQLLQDLRHSLPAASYSLKNHVFRNRNLRCHSPMWFIHSLISHHIFPTPSQPLYSVLEIQNVSVAQKSTSLLGLSCPGGINGGNDGKSGLFNVLLRVFFQPLLCRAGSQRDKIAWTHSTEAFHRNPWESSQPLPCKLSSVRCFWVE